MSPKPLRNIFLRIIIYDTLYGSNTQSFPVFPIIFAIPRASIPVWDPILAALSPYLTKCSIKFAILGYQDPVACICEETKLSNPSTIIGEPTLVDTNIYRLLSFIFIGRHYSRRHFLSACVSPVKNNSMITQSIFIEMLQIYLFKLSLENNLKIKEIQFLQQENYQLQQTINREYQITMQNKSFRQKIARLQNSFYPNSKRRRPLFNKLNESDPRQTYTKSLYDQFSLQQSQASRQTFFKDRKIFYNQKPQQKQLEKISRTFSLSKQHLQRPMKQTIPYPSKKGTEHQNKNQLDKILFSKLKKLNQQRRYQYSPLKSCYPLQNKQTNNIQLPSQRELQSHSQKCVHKQDYKQKVMRKSALYILSAIRRHKIQKRQREKLLQKIIDQKAEKDVLIKIRSTDLSPMQKQQKKVLQENKNKSTARISNKKSQQQMFKQKHNLIQINWKRESNVLQDRNVDNKPKKVQSSIKKSACFSQALREDKKSPNNENKNAKIFKMNYFDDNYQQQLIQINKSNNRLLRNQIKKNENTFDNIKIEPW